MNIMKKLQNQLGVKSLTKTEQQNVKGGLPYIPSACQMEDGVGYCPTGQHCENGTCVPNNTGSGSNGNNSGNPDGPIHIDPNL